MLQRTHQICQLIRDFYGLWQFSFWGYSIYEGMKVKREQNAPVGNLPTVWIIGMMEICVCPREG